MSIVPTTMILLQAEGAGGMGWQNLVMIALIGVVFYFFMIRPQTKRMKEHKKLVENLQKGDRVVTTGGIFGRISEISGDTFLVEIAPNVRIKVQKSAISMEGSKALNKEEESK
ncbi:MAG TPA: preprotein translocase subunit YajC [Anseongella sp.]